MMKKLNTAKSEIEKNTSELNDAEKQIEEGKQALENAKKNIKKANSNYNNWTIKSIKFFIH